MTTATRRALAALVLLVSALAAGCGGGGAVGGDDAPAALPDARSDAPLATDGSDADRDALADGGAVGGPDSWGGDASGHDAGHDALGDGDGGAPDVPPDVPPDVRADVDEGLEEVPIEASAAFRARQAQYLQECFDANGPGQGGLYGQVCRVALGGPDTTLNEVAIDLACAQVDERRDTADFRVAALVRLLYLDDANPVLSAETRAQIEDTLLRFKYWLDEPGQDQMCYWSENHQILFHSAELLAGQRFRDQVLPNAGLTGAEHMAHALPRLERWLELRGRYGFSEWHSNVYFNEDVPALANLADFAEDEGIRTKAAAVLDLLAFDLLNNTYRGYFATAHGRTYPNKLIGGLNDSTLEAAWLLTGLGADLPREAGNFSGAFLATSPRYVAPPLLEEMAAAAAAQHEHRQRDGFDVADGPAVGLTYSEPDDVIVWAGMSAIAAPEVIDGMVGLLDAYDLWEGFLFGDMPAEVRGLLQGLAGTPGLRTLSQEVAVVSYGIALEAMSTYTFRTPQWQLSGAQDHRPGFWSAQTHLWQATLDGQAFVFTSLPSEILLDLGDDVSIGGGWTGSWNPRVTLHRNVGVIQYRVADPSDVLADYIIPGTAHAYVPRSAFDELREAAGWVVGRKGDGYLALWSQAPATWAEGSDYALETGVADTVFVVELGAAPDWPSFDAFVAAVTGAAVSVADGVVTYESPSLGRVTVGWTGPLTVAGAAVDLGPYPRWDNAFATTAVGAPRTRLRHGGAVLELDPAAGTRRLLVPRAR